MIHAYYQAALEDGRIKIVPDIWGDLAQPESLADVLSLIKQKYEPAWLRRNGKLVISLWLDYGSHPLPDYHETVRRLCAKLGGREQVYFVFYSPTALETKNPEWFAGADAFTDWINNSYALDESLLREAMAVAKASGKEFWQPVMPSFTQSRYPHPGVKGDCQHVMDGTMADGASILTSATAQFSPEDVGKPIYVLEAGVQPVAGFGKLPGAPLNSRIMQVKDAHTVVLADPARHAVSGVSVAWGADDTQAIQRAIDSLNTTGGTVFFPAGTYRVVYQGGPGLKVRGSNIRLQGTGPASALFNSTVLFHAKIKDGVTYTEQMGVPVLYIGQPDKAIENVEVDHLWLGDNGQKYDFKVWGPEGWGVIGSAGKVDRWDFHDLTIETHSLCGLNTNSQTEGFSISNVTVRCSANHGFYLAGTGSHGDVHDNHILGTTAPMRIGIAVKKKNHLRITHNEVANVDLQGISVLGDDSSYLSRDVLIADNWIHDLTARHTTAITIFNAEDVRITGNRITDTSFIGIWAYTHVCRVGKVLIKDNILTRVGKQDPAYGISVEYRSPRGLPAGSPAPGSVHDVTIEGNFIHDSPSGIFVSNVEGDNLIRANRVENSSTAGKCRVGYSIHPLSSSKTIFSDNVGVNCARHSVAPHVVQSGNHLE